MPAGKHHVQSFTSTAVGLAVAEGKLSVDDPVLQFFPDEAPGKPSANLRAMRVRDLLTMPNLVWERIVTALEAEALPADAAAHAKLTARLAGLSLRRPAAGPTPPRAKTLAGSRYVFPSNPGLRSQPTRRGFR